MKIRRNRSHVKEKREEASENFFRELDIQLLIHELKDPTGIIVTVLRSLLEKRDKYGPLLPRQERSLQRAAQAISRIQNLLDDILEIGRAEAQQFEQRVFQPERVVYTCLLDILKLMTPDIFEQSRECKSEEAVLIFLAQAGIDFKSSPEVQELEIIQDEIKFRQIVRNLIKNALRFRNKHLAIRLYRREELLSIDIDDDGPGIQPEDHEIIFRRYKQIHRETSLERTGHGLGLAGALIQARRLGGDITVESEPGKGAMFRLVIPIKMEDR